MSKKNLLRTIHLVSLLIFTGIIVWILGGFLLFLTIVTVGFVWLLLFIPVVSFVGYSKPTIPRILLLVFVLLYSCCLYALFLFDLPLRSISDTSGATYLPAGSTSLYILSGACFIVSQALLIIHAVKTIVERLKVKERMD